VASTELLISLPLAIQPYGAVARPVLVSGTSLLKRSPCRFNSNRHPHEIFGGSSSGRELIVYKSRVRLPLPISFNSPHRLLASRLAFSGSKEGDRNPLRYLASIEATKSACRFLMANRLFHPGVPRFRSAHVTGV